MKVRRGFGRQPEAKQSSGEQKRRRQVRTVGGRVYGVRLYGAAGRQEYVRVRRARLASGVMMDSEVNVKLKSSIEVGRTNGQAKQYILCLFYSLGDKKIKTWEMRHSATLHILRLWTVK